MLVPSQLRGLLLGVPKDQLSCALPISVFCSPLAGSFFRHLFLRLLVRRNIENQPLSKGSRGV